MCCSLLAILPICAVIVSSLSFVFQFIALPSDEWGHFATRKIRGIPDEKGHFGLWRLCSTKGGSYVEDCVHPEDTTYQLPIYANAAGAVSIFHLLIMASFIGLAIIRIIQISREAPDLYIGTKRLCIVKVAVALICVILSITVSILASVGEGNIRQFNVFKGWAFWIQILIISVNIVLLLVCAFENIQYWQVRMIEPPPPDPTDQFPETFITPDYEIPTDFGGDRVVYVKDAGVQSQLDGYDGENYLQVPKPSYRSNDRTHKKSRSYEEDEDDGYDNKGATVITISGRGSPHPRKKNSAHPTRVI
ncbi:uncharacterized protein LOC129225650 [Uloborus diversus]|uniref:uncharacterized protein LOC129225650 n=1 Tax=Uloborus diversus TaxID=327109 RepID=UPI002409BD1C|nr:uncharacterized protein LOC129225650 [Uloborus diversus]